MKHGAELYQRARDGLPAWARHLDEVAQTLEEIERLHQRLKDGALDRATFIQQRQALFRRLEVQLQGAARLGTGLQGNESLKKVLGYRPKAICTRVRSRGMRSGCGRWRRRAFLGGEIMEVDGDLIFLPEGA